jgi:hypothetical protein
MEHIMNESYNVKLGHGKPVKSFDTLENAVAFINAGMQKKESETFALFNDTKEMIWLDSYSERDGHTLGYKVSRQEDKTTVSYDEQKGLVINTKVENDEELKAMVVEEAGRMKFYTEAKKLAKFRFVKDTSKDSYIDFEAGCVHYNTSEQLNAAVASLVDQLKAQHESLERTATEDADAWYDMEWDEAEPEEDEKPALTEAAEVKAHYAIKVWDNPEAKKSGSPSFDSEAKEIAYADFDKVLEALRSNDLSEKGAYEITWIKS